jgi:hypothetical protein
MPPVDARTEPIRRAVASGEFGKAQALWEDYAGRLAEEVRSGTFSSAKLEATRELAEWCRVTALCARSHAQGRLNRMAIARQYGAPCAASASASRISARA